MILLRRLLGDVLRERRREQGRTLREVSAAARVSLGYLSEVERGQKEASSELLGSICEALDVPLSEVLREVSDNLALAEALPQAAAGASGAGRRAHPAARHQRGRIDGRSSGYETPQRSPVHPTSTGVWTGVRLVCGALAGRQRGWQRGHQYDEPLVGRVALLGRTGPASRSAGTGWPARLVHPVSRRRAAGRRWSPAPGAPCWP